MIRKAILKDVNSIEDTYNEHFQYELNHTAFLLQATVYVYEDKQEIQGFIGLSNEYIEGIFVSAEMQSQGIGKILLNYVKGKRNKLILNVYQKNTRAISFYQREGFEIQYSGLDEATGEKDYVMAWQQK